MFWGFSFSRFTTYRHKGNREATKSSNELWVGQIFATKNTICDKYLQQKTQFPLPLTPPI